MSKAYEAALSNLGYLPAWVTTCDYVDDTLSRGTMIGYTLEQQNRTTGEWETIVDMNGPDYCEPYPLGIVDAHLTTKLLWPGQSIMTGPEATAAHNEVHRDDRVRFVIQLSARTNTGRAVPAPDFTIDEEPGIEGLRLRH